MKNLALTTVLDIGGILVHSVLKSNQIAQHVIADGKGARQNGGKTDFGEERKTYRTNERAF